MKDNSNKNDEGLDFISIAVHQLRAPLISMKWIAELLLKGEAGELNPEQKEFLTDLYKSVINMNQLVNHLLSVAKIESNQLMMRNGEINPNEVLEEVLLELEPLLQDRNQSLSLKKGELPILKIDRGILSQILKNLLTNSIKYTPKKGKIEVEFSFNKKEKEVLFSVRDNGMGIPKSEQAKIFQRFFRASNAAKSDNEGTGLGLYIVKKFVDMLAGEIWFESEEGKGTTFYLTLPANQ
jgi:signal transduction histidine kinase